MKKHNNLKVYDVSFKIYVRGIRGASELRHQLMSTETVDASSIT